MIRNSCVLLVSLVLMISAARAQDDAGYDTKRQVGLGFAMAETGSGIGLLIAWPLLPDYHVGFAIDGFMLRDSKQMDFYDANYGVPYSINKQNNAYLFDMMLTVKKRLFRETISEELRPFFSAGVGPTYGMNFPESSSNLYPKQDEYRWTMGGFIGAGADFGVKSSHMVTVRAQYRLIPFTEKLGERSNHSMVELRFEIVQRF
jgi:hypothetical protein